LRDRWWSDEDTSSKRRAGPRARVEADKQGTAYYDMRVTGHCEWGSIWKEILRMLWYISTGIKARKDLEQPKPARIG